MCKLAVPWSLTKPLQKKVSQLSFFSDCNAADVRRDSLCIVVAWAISSWLWFPQAVLSS